MPEALDLLKSRRSVKPIELNGPAPTAAELDTLLTVASRVPDHGKLTPWRFIIFEGDARLRAGETIGSVFRQNRPDATPDIQRFFYWNVAKTFYRPELSFEEMAHINFDWFAPANAHRQTEAEVRGWCHDAGLRITSTGTSTRLR